MTRTKQETHAEAVARMRRAMNPQVEAAHLRKTGQLAATPGVTRSFGAPQTPGDTNIQQHFNAPMSPGRRAAQPPALGGTYASGMAATAAEDRPGGTVATAGNPTTRLNKSGNENAGRQFIDHVDAQGRNVHEYGGDKRVVMPLNRNGPPTPQETALNVNTAPPAPTDNTGAHYSMKTLAEKKALFHQNLQARHLKGLK
jgi:hypothetical protein